MSLQTNQILHYLHKDPSGEEHYIPLSSLMEKDNILIPGDEFSIQQSVDAFSLVLDSANVYNGSLNGLTFTDGTIVWGCPIVKTGVDLSTVDVNETFQNAFKYGNGWVVKNIDGNELLNEDGDEIRAIAVTDKASGDTIADGDITLLFAVTDGGSGYIPYELKSNLSYRVIPNLLYNKSVALYLGVPVPTSGLQALEERSYEEIVNLFADKKIVWMQWKVSEAVELASYGLTMTPDSTNNNWALKDSSGAVIPAVYSASVGVDATTTIVTNSAELNFNGDTLQLKDYVANPAICSLGLQNVLLTQELYKDSIIEIKWRED